MKKRIIYSYHTRKALVGAFFCALTAIIPASHAFFGSVGQKLGEGLGSSMSGTIETVSENLIETINKNVHISSKDLVSASTIIQGTFDATGKDLNATARVLSTGLQNAARSIDLNTPTDNIREAGIKVASSVEKASTAIAGLQPQMESFNETFKTSSQALTTLSTKGIAFSINPNAAIPFMRTLTCGGFVGAGVVLVGCGAWHIATRTTEETNDAQHTATTSSSSWRAYVPGCSMIAGGLGLITGASWLATRLVR